MLYYVGNVSYILRVLLRRVFLLQARCYDMWGISLPRPMRFCVGSFSYTPHAIFMWGVSLTRHMLFCVGSLSYTPHAIIM